jgi:hypothetical protein
MKVGDLVKHLHDPDYDSHPLGIILDFDADGDPIISFIESAAPLSRGHAYYLFDIEVVSESR